MPFDSEQAAYDFYNSYGGRIDFSVRKCYVNKSKTGDVISKLFVCNKEGLRDVDKRDPLIKKSQTRNKDRLRAQFHIKFNKCNIKYVVDVFNEYHNHALVFPKCAHVLPSQRKIFVTQAIEVELAEQSGIPLIAAYELMGRKTGGRAFLEFTKIDQKSLAYGETGSVLQYFQKKTIRESILVFIYAIELDNEEQITNVFWSDA